MRVLGRLFPPRESGPPPRLIWFENEVAIYKLARSSIGWLADCRYGDFWHHEDRGM